VPTKVEAVLSEKQKARAVERALSKPRRRLEMHLREKGANFTTAACGTPGTLVTTTDERRVSCCHCLARLGLSVSSELRNFTREVGGNGGNQG
jgi:hypothetical protein